ncbi:MAG: peptidoglycan editing factor PgeF [Burkholderiales bacterium]|nr:peptidoglycan editing factor PgeF [Burkholderiales bacterium]MDQ3196725.1 peptidoglycan editing factor PgeF [Pseudomonadota bacterium]
MTLADCIIPDWPAPRNVRALITTRSGGVSAGPYRSFNLGDQVDDQPQAVAENRRRLRCHLPADPLWLSQRHETVVADAGAASPARNSLRTAGTGGERSGDWVRPFADAGVAHRTNAVCAVLTADCLPVLLCDRAGSCVAVAHAGWRGLAAGIIEETVRAMRVQPSTLIAWLGPAIGPRKFEVGDDVLRAFTLPNAAAKSAFIALRESKWLADIYALARMRLIACGVTAIYGGEYCTVSDDRFFSHRRDKITGRFASLIWLAN